MKKIILLLSVILLLGSHAAVEKQQSAPASLKEAYRDAFLIGSSVNQWITSERAGDIRELLLRQFNTITIENAMKAGPVNPRPGEYNFAPADALVEFGLEQGMFIVGHTLVWHNQTPDWFFTDEHGNPNSPDEQIERMRSHIEAVAGRYAGKVHAWDVVNEVIDDDGSYRETSWVKAVGDGDELVKQAFRFAAEYAPGTELYYNDFNAWRPAKRDGIVRLVKLLQEEGFPDKVQQQLSDRYEELFSIFHRHRDLIDRVTFWGVHDGMSWKNGYPVPGRTNYPMLFDRNGLPKPAYHTVLQIPETLPPQVRCRIGQEDIFSADIDDIFILSP